MSYISKYTGQEIDNKLDQISSLNTNKVSKNGDSMTGTLNLPYLNIKRNGSTGFCQVFKDDIRTALFQQMTDSNQLHICQSPPGDGVNVEGYRFPIPDTELTAHKWYDIITTKNLDKIYPVGAVYISVNSTSPASLFGGTWEKIEGRFLFASNSNYPVGDVGGETRHTLTINEIPSHTHKLRRDMGGVEIGIAGGDGSVQGNALDGTYTTVSIFGSSIGAGATGGSESHNNMPPYLVVNMWQRTA